MWIFAICKVCSISYGIKATIHRTLLFRYCRDTVTQMATMKYCFHRVFGSIINIVVQKITNQDVVLTTSYYR